MRVAFALALVVHGLIHLLGVAKAFGFAELPQLTRPISPVIDGEGLMLQQGSYLPVRRVHQGLIFSRGNRSLGVTACYDKHVLLMVPVAPDHIALERPAGADRHRKNITRLRDDLELDVFGEPDVAVCHGFHCLLSRAAETEGGNPEAYLDCLRHLMTKGAGIRVPT